MKEFICIVCPRGCRLSVDEQLNVTGNKCNRGVSYVLNELKDPKRMLTSTVKINSKLVHRLPVITSSEISKDKIFAVMEEINKVEVTAPIKIKDVIIKNVLNLGVDVIATRSILE
jgi:CxxC motif-containing protein